MGKIVIVHWSGTGNTEAMAGATENGCEFGKKELLMPAVNL